MLILSCFHNNFYPAFKRLSNLNIQIHVVSRFRQLNASVYRENYWACLNKIFRASPICILQSLISKYRYDFSNNIVAVVYFLVLPIDFNIIHITNCLSDLLYYLYFFQIGLLRFSSICLKFWLLPISVFLSL